MTGVTTTGDASASKNIYHCNYRIVGILRQPWMIADKVGDANSHNPLNWMIIYANSPHFYKIPDYAQKSILALKVAVNLQFGEDLECRYSCKRSGYQKF